MSQHSIPFNIRVRAVGGKFLGDDIGGAQVTVRDAVSGKILAHGVTSGNSGTLVKSGETLSPPRAFGPVIVTPPVPPSGPNPVSTTATFQWLVADSGTSQFSASWPISEPTSEPTLVDITAFGPLGGLQSAKQVTTRTWIVPGTIPRPLPPPSGPVELGFVVELPGLLLQVLEPATHRNLIPPQSPDPCFIVDLAVKVAMMCGCPISAVSCGDFQTWPETDFDVTAKLFVVGGSGTPTSTVPLQFAGSCPPKPGEQNTKYGQNNDTCVTAAATPDNGYFIGKLQVEIPSGKAVNYKVVFTAIQKSTGNVGTGMVTLIANPHSASGNTIDVC